MTGIPSTTQVMTRRCGTCGLEKPIEEFPRKKDGKYGRASWCSACNYKKVKEWRSRNPTKRLEQNRRHYHRHHDHYLQRNRWRYIVSHERRLEIARRAMAKVRATLGKIGMRETRLKWKYGISLEDYNRVLAQQGGVCAICGSHPGRRPLDVDHDHKTGRIRGLLCESCNKALGLFRDDPSILRKAAEYVECCDLDTLSGEPNV